jgi:hypothetical protein
VFVGGAIDEAVVEMFPERVDVVLAEPVRKVTVLEVVSLVVVVDIVALSATIELDPSDMVARPPVPCVIWDEKD